MTVAIIVLIRVLWRWNHQPPPLPPGTPSWVVNASRLSHGLLYALLVLMPVAGFTASNFTKYGVTYFGLFKIGPFFAENKTLYELFQGIHHAASEVLVIVIAIHIAGAFKHLSDRQGWRVLPHAAGPLVLRATKDAVRAPRAMRRSIRCGGCRAGRRSR